MKARLSEGKFISVMSDGSLDSAVMEEEMVYVRSASRPNVLGIHCMAHKLELAFSDGIRKNVMVRKSEDLLSGLYTVYHKSGVNRASLKQHFRVLHMKALMPTRSQEATNINALLRAKAKGFLNIAMECSGFAVFSMTPSIN
ncbi:unnamed protein product [Arctogadus glacialis]